jgi:RNA polymerase sigma factor (sigma-70 family)
MPTSKMSEAIRQVRRTMLRNDAGRTDVELLESFVRQHDDAALTALVHRHGSMVWGVCRRLLRSQHDAEDAFQATFLVLVRKAAAIRDKELVANWLYGVAHQTAVRARTAAAKRGVRERQVTEMPEPAVAAPDHGSDLQPLLDQELSRLPAYYRVPIVLCDLEGKTRQEAARHLGWPEGTVAGRLARARTMLAKRLTRRGLVMSSVTLAAVLSQNAVSACVPTSVLYSTIKFTHLFAAGQATAGIISPNVAALTEGVLRTMLMAKLKTGMAILLAVAAVAIGVVTISASSQGPVEATAVRVNNTVSTVDQDDPTRDAPEPKLADTFQGHTDTVLSATFSPDGMTLASGSGDNTIKLWDVATGKERATIQGHTQPVWSVVFSPDGKTLASGSWDGTTKLWDVGTGKERAKLLGPGGWAVSCVAFSPEGKVLASGSEGKTIQLWDVATGKEGATLQGHTGWVRTVAFSPDGKQLASGGHDMTVRLWDVATGKEQAVLKGHTNAVWTVAFRPDGQTLASGSSDMTIILWDMATKKEQATLKGHRCGVQAVAYSPDAQTLASASGDQTIKLWDVTTNKELATLTLKGRTSMCFAAFSPNSKTLASASDKTTIKLWDVQAAKQADK